MPNPKTLELLINLFESVDRFGVNNTLGIIDDGHRKFDEELKFKIERIIKVVCREYNITKEKLLVGRSNYDRTESLAILFYIINQKLNLNGKQIANIFKKSDSLVSRSITKIKDLSDTHPRDKKILDKLNNITKELES